MKHFIAIALTAFMLTACNNQNNTNATAGNSDSVKARQDMMQDWRGANDIMKGMMEKPDTFDAAVFREQAEFINDGNSTMWTHFADQNAKGKSQDAVWTDAAGFSAKKDEFMTASANLAAQSASATSADDIKEAFGKMAESCGSCHKVYKQ